MKFISYIKQNFLFLITILLLVVIPVYPKIPIIDIEGTWVYVRLEDFLVAFVVFIWGVQLFRKKATIKTPLTIPFAIFFGVGLISTLHATIFVFPGLADVRDSLAWLFYLRHVEYMILFFIAYSSAKNAKQASIAIVVMAITLLFVVFYGIGQKLFGFPAFLTGNEEFAKGIPLRISAQARVPSTFAGHYDLAAYLVMLIPIMGSMIFAYKKMLSKVAFFLTSFFGLILLLMTASRVSFAVYLASVTFMLILQKQKKFIIPVIIASLFISNYFTEISQRFGSTISQADLVVDARTGKPIGIAKTVENGKIIIEETTSTGEDLPQGTGYINLPTDGKVVSDTMVEYRRSRVSSGKESIDITTIEGNFIIKKVYAYDVSFTTRFQGTWPRAIKAFLKNPLLGSGYSSISLASDGNYMRILGETGILGLLSFLFIFLILGIYSYKILPHVESKVVKALVLGVLSGVFGLFLNAVLIDVFEASKVAFILWTIIGLTLGLMHLYQKHPINYLLELRRVLVSIPALLIYLLAITFASFSIIIKNYFVADDFTWLRWVADCKKIFYSSGEIRCEPTIQTFISYFTQSDGFFYRPGTKLYFYYMYSLFWLNHGFYHAASIFVHFLSGAAVFLIILRLLRSKLIAFFGGFLFIIFAFHYESVFWISASGHLIASAASLFAIYFLIEWHSNRKIYLLVLSWMCAIAAPAFHEFGVLVPVGVLIYEVIFIGKNKMFENNLKKVYYLAIFLIIPLYLLIRFTSGSHWQGGDYTYNFAKLPFNLVGNLAGYLGITFFGISFLTFYEQARSYSRGHIAVFVLLSIIIAGFASYIIYILRRVFMSHLKFVLFGSIFFAVNLLPFLGLGNIAPRYAYLSSFGLVFLIAYLVQNIFENLRKFGKIVSFGFIAALFVLLGIINILQLYAINKDWIYASSVTNKLLVGFNDYFPRANATPKNPVFYFVNVPIKYGTAWIFPVGFEDALWFTFQNENLTIHKMQSLELALDSAEASFSARVFEFKKDGSVEEVVREKITPAPTYEKNK